MTLFHNKGNVISTVTTAWLGHLVLHHTGHNYSHMESTQQRL